MGFALSDSLIHWSFTRGEGSIPFTRSTSPPFSLNGLQLRWSCGDSDSHKGFNEQHMRYDVPTMCLRINCWIYRYSLLPKTVNFLTKGDRLIAKFARWCKFSFLKLSGLNLEESFLETILVALLAL